jgi:rhodanese-related sulfurtransferase
MIRFNSTIAGGVLVGLSAVYMGVALASGHSARSELPPDLSASAPGLDVWKTLALLLEQGEQVQLVDVRPVEQFQQYHLPGSRNLPGASAGELRAAVEGRRSGVVIASSDDKAAKLVGEASAGSGGAALHFLLGGAQSWYLALELPVPLFSDKEPPYGYAESMALLRSWLGDAAPATDREQLQQALNTLASSGYEPSQLAGKKKKPAGGAKKKISGGCG